MNKINTAFIARTLMAVIRLYQMAVAPIWGPCCRFVPSCSHYFMEALESKGLLKALMLGLKRILRCHPFHAGGFDPVK